MPVILKVQKFNAGYLLFLLYETHLKWIHFVPRRNLTPPTRNFTYRDRLGVALRLVERAASPFKLHLNLQL